MKFEEINELVATDLTDRGWLREIALQLATLNDKFALPVVSDSVIAEVPQKRGPGRPRKMVN